MAANTHAVAPDKRPRSPERHVDRASSSMLRWAMVFLVVAIIAAAFGFGGAASGAVAIAQVLFFLFLVLFLGSLVLGFAGAKRK